MAAQLSLFGRPVPAPEPQPRREPPPPEPWRGFAGLDEEFRRRTRENDERQAAWGAAHPPKAAGKMSPVLLPVTDPESCYRAPQTDGEQGLDTDGNGACEAAPEAPPAAAEKAPNDDCDGEAEGETTRQDLRAGFSVLLYDLERYAGENLAPGYKRGDDRFLLNAWSRRRGDRFESIVWTASARTHEEARRIVPAGGVYFDRPANYPSAMVPIEGWRFAAPQPQPKTAQDEPSPPPPAAAASSTCLLCHAPAVRADGERTTLCPDCRARLEQAGWAQVAREQLAWLARASGRRTHCPRCTSPGGACLTCSSAVETDPGIGPCASR